MNAPPPRAAEQTPSGPPRSSPHDGGGGPNETSLPWGRGYTLRDLEGGGGEGGGGKTGGGGGERGGGGGGGPLAQNVGVSAGLNVCARSGRGELVGLFNNDLELSPDCLAELVAALAIHQEAGSAACKLMDFGDRSVIDGTGDVFRWTATGWRRGHGQRDHGQYDRPTAIFGACGGAAVYRRSVFERVGLFDEDFVAFYEDVDWNLRAQLAGFECRYVPTAVAFHIGSATLGRGLTDFTRYHLWRNALWIIAKDLPVTAVFRHAHQLILGQLMNLAVAIRDRKLRIWLRVWRDAVRGLPRVLYKRREVQARRRISLRALEAVVGDAEPPGHQQRSKA